MPPISVMIKPASSACNLRCKYCFYHDVAENRELPFKGMMTTAVLEEILQKAFAFADGADVMLSFQGGEPLLRGKAFFKAFFHMLDRINVRRSPVYLGLQTNGTLIDEEWCDIFKKNNFLVGLSLDGDEIANVNRVDENGEPIFEKVLAAAKLMQERGVQFNILSVLTKSVALRIDKIYNFFKAQGFTNLQFIPCLKPLDGQTDNPDLYMDSKAYTLYLLSAFALYQRDLLNGQYVSIRQFDNFVRLAKFELAEQCGMNGYCTHQYVVEGDGTVYPCDFYCTDDNVLGNIKETDFAKIEKSRKAIDFIKESLITNEKCKKCDYFMLCRGGCKRERISLEKCDAYKTFFKFALPYLKKIT